MPATTNGDLSDDVIRGWLGERIPERLMRIASAFRHDISIDLIAEATSWDMWFLCEIKAIIDAEKMVQANGLPQNPNDMLSFESHGVQ